MNRYEFDDVVGRRFIVQVCSSMAEEGLLAVDEQGQRSMLLTKADARKLARVLDLYGCNGTIDQHDCPACCGSGVVSPGHFQCYDCGGTGKIPGSEQPVVDETRKP